MTAPLVLSDDAGPVRVLAMNRPEARNALNTKLIEALYVALCDADADPSVRAVVLTGVDPAFCAGVDLKRPSSSARSTSSNFTPRAAFARQPRCASR